MKRFQPGRMRRRLLALALVVGFGAVGIGGCWPTPMAPGGEDDSEEKEDGEGGPDSFQSLSLHFAEVYRSN